MVSQIRRRGEKLRYFFYDGELHTALHIHLGKDIITAWSYPRGERRKYNYTDVKRRGGRAWTTAQVAKMIGRTVRSIEGHILNGDIEPPQMTYGLNENRRKYKYMWSEDDVMRLHEFLCTVHVGRPRKDGMVTPRPMPSASQLRAMMRQQTILYIETKNGFVPTWQAENF